MAAIGNAELLQNVNACQARWMTHLIGDVHSGQADHARAYLKDCRQSFATHQQQQHSKQAALATQAAANGVAGFMHLDGMSGMAGHLDPSQLQTVQIGNAERLREAAMFKAKTDLHNAEREAAMAAQTSASISGAARGTNPRRAGNAFYRTKHKLKSVRRKLRRCRARVRALEEGQSPEQADAAAFKVAPPSNPTDLGGLSGCACGGRRPGMAGLGYTATPGSGIPQQFQHVEQRQPWASRLPQQSIAEGFAYRLPATSSAFLEREAKVRGGHGGVFAGKLQAGTPAGIHPALAAHFAQLQAVQRAQQAAFQRPWTNPWTYQQFFDNTAQGLPIWGGGYTQPFRPTPNVPGGTAYGAQPPVAGGGRGGGYPQPGSATERF
jgi:hypothetical protein